jgi:hypothetical protein
MAEFTAPTTRLEAVNSVLASVGGRPVNSISAPARQDVIQAVAALDETSRMVQNKGWYWNRENEVTLTPDGDGFLNVPSTALRCRVSAIELNSTTRHYIFRDSRLYNRTDRTFVFTSNVKVDLIHIHPFDELPDPARWYIWARAGAVFQARHVSSEIVFRFTESMAQVSWAGLLHDEQSVERFNIFESGAHRDLNYRR